MWCVAVGRCLLCVDCCLVFVVVRWLFLLVFVVMCLLLHVAFCGVMRCCVPFTGCCVLFVLGCGLLVVR